MRPLVALALAIITACGEPPAPTSTASVTPTSPTIQSSASASAPTASTSAAPRVAPVAPDAAQKDRLRADVAAVSVERVPGSKGWQATQKLIVDRLTSLGFTPTLERFDGGGVNVLAEQKGTRNLPRVILSAHYDHIRGCRGADDNASGVAVVLEAARQLRGSSAPRTLTLAFWDREEDGLEGSMFHATQARGRGEEILVAISLDSVGFASSAPNSQELPGALEAMLPDVFARARENQFRADFIAALGDADAAPLLARFETFGATLSQPAFGVPLSGLARLALSDAARSDHASFWLQGYSGVMITDTANFRNPRYHCRGGSDDPDTLDHDFLNRVASVVVATTREALATP